MAQHARIGEPRARCHSANSVAHSHCRLPSPAPSPASPPAGLTRLVVLETEAETPLLLDGSKGGAVALGRGGSSGGDVTEMLVALIDLRPSVTLASNASLT